MGWGRHGGGGESDKWWQIVLQVKNIYNVIIRHAKVHSSFRIPLRVMFRKVVSTNVTESLVIACKSKTQYHQRVVRKNINKVQYKYSTGIVGPVVI